MDDSKKKRRPTTAKMCWLAYIQALKEHPVLTKAATSAIMGMTGNVTAQLINKYKGEIDEMSLPSIARFGTFGFVITGPLMHFFYKWLDATFPPSKSKENTIKRFLTERLLLAPTFSFLFHAAMAGMEYKHILAVVIRVRQLFWPTLLMNWKYWTVLQFLVVTYIPRDLKPLVASLFGLLWNVLLSTGKFLPSS